MDNNDEWEERENENRKRNKKYLKEFNDWLKENSYADKTIKRHMKNIDLYINEYLNYYEITKMEDGINDVNSFLDSWFIEKCLVTKSSLKEMTASLKKFYKCMSEKGYTKEEEYKHLCQIIKENMDEYLDNLKAYENGTYYDRF